MELELHQLAEGDLLAGFHFYERQFPGLGHYFLDSLYADLEALLLYGGIHRKVFGYYRLLAKTFPYAVYYRVKSDRVIVFRILDCRIDPKRHRAGLGD